MLSVLALICGLAGMARAAPLTAEEARAASDRAVQLLWTVNQSFSDEYFHSGDWEKAVAALDRLIALRPDEVEPYANAAWLLWSTDKVDRAMEYYTRMLVNNPTDPEGYFTIGNYYYFTRRDYAAALPYLEKAVGFGLKSPERHLYGHCLERLGHTAEALAFWQKLLADDPQNAVAMRQIEKLTQKEEPAAPENGETEEPPAAG